MTPVERILVAPATPRRGEPMQVCYDFVGLNVSEVQLDVGFDPTTGSCGLELSPGSPCATVQVPDAALGVLIVDQSGNSADFGSPIVP